MRIRLGRRGSEVCGTLAPGFRVMHDAPSWERPWLELLNNSREFGVWDRDKLREKILSGLIPFGGILVRAGPRFVATASACALEEFLPRAVLQYVLVHPGYRRKGLGRMITLHAMDSAYRAGYPEMILKTDDFRRGAIALYLQLGFEPDIDSLPETRDRWHRVLADIRP